VRAESSRGQSRRVSLKMSRHGVCGLLKMAAEAVRTHQQIRVESSRVESCRDKSLCAACLIFVTQNPVFGREGRNGIRDPYIFNQVTLSNLQRLAL